MNYFFSAETFLMILRLAVPLILVSLSSTLSELCGVISLGTEGLMLIGAFGGVVGSYYFNNPVLGIICSMLFGMILAYLFSILCIKFKANQTVCGVGMNLFAQGFSAVGTYIIWGQEGISEKVKQLNLISIPLLKNIPILGFIFNKQSPVFFLTILLSFLIWYVLKYTKTGLHLKAISDEPIAANTVGINVKKYRYITMIISGLLAGLGGGYLSIVQNNVFVNNMTAGRGFLGVAANIFGGWTPIGFVLSSFIFAIAQAIRFKLVGLSIPDQFVQMVPYLITIFALIFLANRKQAPKALGKMD